MKQLLKRLEILKTAIELEDQELVLSQKAALEDLIKSNAYSDALQSEIRIILSDLLENRQDEAQASIKSFLLACYGGNNLSANPLANELGQLSAQFSEFIMQRDGIIRRAEYFVHDYTERCGDLLEQLLSLQKQDAEMRLRQAEVDFAEAQQKLQKLSEQRELNRDFASKEPSRAENEAYREALILLCRTGCDPETATALQTAYTVGSVDDINQIAETLRKRTLELSSSNEEMSILVDLAGQEIKKLQRELDNINSDETCRLLSVLQDPDKRAVFMHEQEEMLRSKINNA